ncbi:universal stress protein [Halorubrum sp. BOL3-1]|uniref:universal stress protein n=1 Tax=Halorubrum sp. BOL3-1 TaxID=2497325 RepID=UPI001004EE89|nr:universal stress protein [Halorubrum sp. BOL3-1]QAU12470.1 universal stress protein [Halorubrum sp. BOL3-1]
MSSSADGEAADLLGRVLLPVANEGDALATARALEPYDPERVTALHVVEKGEGVPDKTPVEQSEELAAESYAAVLTVFPDADEHTAYGRDVAAEIFEAVDAVDATAVVYRARGGNRLMRFLSGDLSTKLATGAPVPVVALPREEAGE